MADKPIDTTDQQAVTVAQEDREAAAIFSEAVAGKSNGRDAIAECRAGKQDATFLVQAFARHRLASVSSASAGMKPWRGGGNAPSDWDGGPVVMIDPSDLSGDAFMEVNVPPREMPWKLTVGWKVIVAYTPKSEPVPATNQAGEVLPANDEDLAMALCEADGHDPHEMTYHFTEPGVQEPYGDRWNHYVPQATRLRAALATQPATSQEASNG